MEEATLTLEYTVTLKPEPNVTAADKEEFIKQQILDQAASLARNYDWGIAVVGEVTSSLTDMVEISEVKPDYQE